MLCARTQIASVIVCLAAVISQGLSAWGSVHLVHQHKIARRYLQWLNILLVTGALVILVKAIDMVSGAAQMVDELSVVIYVLIALGSFLVIVSMLDCLGAWHDELTLVKCIADWFMYLVLLLLVAAGAFCVLGSQAIIESWVETQQLFSVSTDGASTGSTKLLEFQGYTGATTVDEAKANLEEECEIMGLITLGVSWMLVVGLISEWELQKYYGVGCCTRKRPDVKNRKRVQTVLGVCRCMHPSTWGQSARQFWVKNAALIGSVLCFAILAVVAIAVATAFAVPDPDLQAVEGGTARIELVLEQSISTIPDDTRARVDFRESLSMEVATSLAIDVDAVVTMEIRPYDETRRAMQTNSTSSWQEETRSLIAVTLYILPSALNVSSTTNLADQMLRYFEEQLYTAEVYPILSLLLSLEYTIVDELVVGYGSIQFDTSMAQARGED
eukprot:SAG11_NODE_5022_length_1688_cov_2.528819_1_plen_442_part_10